MTNLDLPTSPTTPSETLAVAFGVRLRTLRERAHLHIVSMARNLQISTEQLELIEAGVQEPNLLLLQRIAQCFDMSISELLEDL